MLDVPKGLKPGWYLILVLLAFAVVASFGWRAAVVELREARMELAGRSPTLAVAGGGAAPSAPALADPQPSPTAGTAPSTDLAGDTGLWFPVPGARVPTDDAHLPGAPRPYRTGVSEGFVFWPEGAGVPLGFGTPVVAAAAGEVVRADEPYAELDAEAWEALLVSVADGADDRELDALRGRQVWIRLDDGRVLRYGHLSGVRPGLTVGQRVGRGRVVGYVGNSGTFDGIVGRTTNARLHFEIRDGDGFVGEGLDADGVRWLAASLFTGP
jgi:peptidoglycan LD-endopeptidase LytH